MDLICIHAFHSRLFLPNYFMLKSLSINLRKNEYSETCSTAPKTCLNLVLLSKGKSSMSLFHYGSTYD